MPLDAPENRGYTAVMRHLLCLLASSLLLSPAVRAGSPAPAEKPLPPSLVCESWGPNPEQRVRDIFQKLLDASGYDGPVFLKKDNRKPTELIYSDKFLMIEGTPAGALMARLGQNKKDNAIIFVTHGALEFCDEKKLAFILGHEIAHLVNEHPKKLVDYRMSLFEPWYDAAGDRVAGLDAKASVALFAKETQSKVGAFTKALEREADTDGISLMGLAGYDQAGAEIAMQDAEEWLRAINAFGEDPTHDPLALRAVQLAALRRQMDAAARAGTLSGGR